MRTQDEYDEIVKVNDDLRNDLTDLRIEITDLKDEIKILEADKRDADKLAKAVENALNNYEYR